MEAESFDKKIRELLDGADFPYQEADWQHAQALLQKERKRKGLWWLWLLPALVGGTAWWMFLPSQAETEVKTQLQMPASATVEQPENAIDPVKEELETAFYAGETASSVNRDPSTAPESTPVAPGFELSGEHGGAQMAGDFEKAADKKNGTNEAAEGRDFIASLLLKSASLQGMAFEKPAPSTKAVEPLQIDRPQANSSPVWMLGLYAASQPNWYENGEKGAGGLNWQAGALASLQFNNGFYGQWLTGLQQQDLRNWSYNNTTTTYDFGFERTSQTLALRDYWTIQNALHIGYARGNHRVYASITHQHYLFSRYRLNTLTERQDAPAISQTESGRAAWLEVGTPRFLPGLGYQYNLSRAFRLGMQYQFLPAQRGIDILPAAAPWQISLQYHLFQRQQP